MICCHPKVQLLLLPERTLRFVVCCVCEYNEKETIKMSKSKQQNSKKHTNTKSKPNKKILKKTTKKKKPKELQTSSVVKQDNFPSGRHERNTFLKSVIWQ